MFIPSIIKSIQFAQLNIGTPLAITAVDPNYAVVISNSFISDSLVANSVFSVITSYTRLTSGTQVDAIGNSGFHRITIIEFYPSFLRQPIQRGVISLLAGTNFITTPITPTGAKGYNLSGGYWSRFAGFGSIPNDEMPYEQFNGPGGSMAISCSTGGGLCAGQIDYSYQIVDPR